MSKSKRGRHFSLPQLIRRGWTAALVSELLPRPHSIPVGGGRMRVWDKKDVLAAEQTLQIGRAHV